MGARQKHFNETVPPSIHYIHLGQNTENSKRVRKMFKIWQESIKSKTEYEKYFGYETTNAGYETTSPWVRNVQTAGYKTTRLATKRPGYCMTIIRK